jgi:DNA-binding NtrC family response regulator
MSSFKIFIVEDEKLYASLLQFHLSLNPDYEVEIFLDGNSLINHLHERPDVITLDYSLIDTKADKLLKQIKQTLPDTPVVIVSGQESLTVAVDLLKEGAYDYIVKNEDTKTRLWNTIKNIRELSGLKQELDQLKTEIGKKYDIGKELKGNSPALQKVFSLIEKAASTHINVSITGETGTGKELVAKAIHYNSNRKSRPFVVVNVAAIPKDLIESELFGHEKGAFTGAYTRRMGKFEAADKGTLFLDEIAELDVHLQAKLLRVLQEREVMKVGGNTSIKIDTRIIVATHKNLTEEVQNGRFREDLYYRLLGLPIALPPLRERGNDILLLAKTFLDLFCHENQLGSKTLAVEARERLLKYNFPGNVRELKSIIELAAVLSDGNEIRGTDLTFHPTHHLQDILSEDLSMEAYEVKIIQHYLKKYDNNVVVAAQKLGIGKSTIYRLLQENKI